MKDIEQLAVGMPEILSETVEGDDYPVCVAGFTRSEGWCWLSDDGFLSERDNPSSEAGELGRHNRLFPLHFLVI